MTDVSLTPEVMGDFGQHRVEPATGTALALPKPADLAVMFKAEGGLDPFLTKLERDALAMVKDLDPAVKKDRALMKTAANLVSQSKAEIDRQGKALTEAQRKEVAAVNAGRKVAEEFLAALRDRVRKPADDWEAADQARKDRIRLRLDAFKPPMVPSGSEGLRALIAEIEAVTVDATWQEFAEEATLAKSNCLNRLAEHLGNAVQREADAAELARLRAEAAARAEADRIKAEEEARAKAEAERVAREAAEAEARAKVEAERAARIEAEKAEAARIAAERERAAAAEREAALARQAEESAERHRRELAEAEAKRIRDLEEAKAREEAAAKAERDRIAREAEEKRKADEARAADEAHRFEIRAQIVTCLIVLESFGKLTPEDIADALMQGQIKHCEVQL